MKIEEAHALFNSQYLGQWIVCPEFETSEKFRLDGITISDININDGKLITIPKYSLVITGDFFRGTCGFNQTGQCDMDASYILLRSVQDLTDEECKEMCQVFSNFSGYTTLIIDAEIDQEEGTFTFWYHENGDRRCSYVEFEHLPQPCTDYLKLKGYLLDFTYLSDDNKPVTLSPATLISMGWARVK